ncbi:MAG: cbb3-type cytochrome c oxidase subunit I [Deltaproteobacteria bacterium]|nr:cbb3-type cytochrome c oxidase subunit I [Deltaproteobacteria bacterium]
MSTPRDEALLPSTPPIGRPPDVLHVEPDYLRAEKGVVSWLLTKDHKRIALMFLVATTLALIAGGAFALLLRLELLTPRRTLMDATTYNRLFTMHGIVLVFMFMIPAIPAIFGNFVLPIMLGAKDLAFPRINLASFYVYVVGSAVTVWGLIESAVDTGWTFYVPYSSTSTTAVVPVGIGVFLLGMSSIMTGLNFIVTTHTLRAQGMDWHRMPLFVWAIYATSVIQILATPVLGLALLLVALDHGLKMGIFDPTLGGDPVLFQHLFWLYSHPAVYIMILPAMGVISETVCTFSHKVPAGYRAIAYSSLGIAFVGLLGWGHHMFVAGMSEFSAGAFSILSMFIAIFSAIKVLTWVATLYRGSITFNTPLLYFFWFLFLFVFGGMTGVAVATSSLDVHWHDTYFVVAHFHFIMVGGTLTSYLAALHYWFPKMFGRLYSERVGLFASALVFMGFFLTFTPQFLLGNAGMPRRYYSYPDRFQWLNVLSTGGAFLLALGLLLTLVYLLVALKWGTKAGPNPWGSRSFEWLTPSPPPKHNFVETPVVARGPYDYFLTEDEAHARAKAR